MNAADLTPQRHICQEGIDGWPRGLGKIRRNERIAIVQVLDATRECVRHIVS